MATAKQNITQPEQRTQPKFRYSCHGCTKNAGFYQNSFLNGIVICPHCGMEQLSKLENFIAL